MLEVVSVQATFVLLLSPSAAKVGSESFSLCVGYLVIVGSVSQQATEGDGIGDASQVNEEHGGDGLNVETLVEITRQPR